MLQGVLKTQLRLIQKTNKKDQFTFIAIFISCATVVTVDLCNEINTWTYFNISVPNYHLEKVTPVIFE